MGIPQDTKSPESRNAYILSYLDSRSYPPEYKATLDNIRAKQKAKIPLGPGDNKALELVQLEAQKMEAKKTGRADVVAALDAKIQPAKNVYKLADPQGYQQLAAGLPPKPTESQTTGYNLNGTPAPQGGQVSTMPVGGVKQSPGGPQALSSRGAAIQYDDQGRPIRNDYLSVADGQGNLLNQFSLANRIGADVSVNQDGLNKIRENALATGPSEWAKLAGQDQQLKQQNLLNQSNKTNMASQNQAMSQLASKGGISQGQRERLALQGQRQLTAGNQGILNQGMQAQLNIGMQDQQRKDQMLGQLPGMDLQNAQFQQGQRQYKDAAQQFDLGNQLKDVAGFNAYRADSYGEAAKMWGAAKSADAQAAASGGGGKK